MQPNLQHADPHDAIAAQLRNLTPRPEQGSAEANTIPVTQGTIPTEAASEPPLRAEPLNDNAAHPISHTRSGYRGARVLLAGCAVAVAALAWHAYGEQARQRLTHLAPHLLAGAQALAQGIGISESKDTGAQIAAPQPAAVPAPAQDAAATTAVQPSPPTAASATESPPAPTAVPAELASSIESMAGEIASLKQAVDELKAGQQQMARDMAKAAEHETRRKPIAQTSKPTPPTRRQHVSAPAATGRAHTSYLPPQPYSQQVSPQSPVQREAYIPPPAPARLPPQPGDADAPRPPMPLR